MAVSLYRDTWTFLASLLCIDNTAETWRRSSVRLTHREQNQTASKENRKGTKYDAVGSTIFPLFFSLFSFFFLSLYLSLWQRRYHFSFRGGSKDREHRNKVAHTRVERFVHSQGSKIGPDQWSVTIPESNSTRRRNSIRGGNCPVGTNKIQSLFRRVSFSSRSFSRSDTTACATRFLPVSHFTCSRQSAIKFDSEELAKHERGRLTWKCLLWLFFNRFLLKRADSE